MKSGGRVLFALALGCAPGCEARDVPLPARGRLPPGVVARVGGQSITAAEVSRIALAQGLDAAAACRVAVRETLLARGAEASGLAESPDARLSWQGELARHLLRRILASARATPPTEAELRDAAARRWLEIERPEGFRTVHAVVHFEPGDSNVKKASARALAEAIHAAALPIAERAAALPGPLPERGASPSGLRSAPQDDPDPLSAAFRQAVASLPTGGLEVTAEPLPPVTVAGRLLTAGDQHLDEDFTRAATVLPARGALSPVVESRFGAHVILLLERTPAIVLDSDTRLAKLRDDIANERARAAEKQLLARVGERRSVTPDATALLGLVAVDP